MPKQPSKKRPALITAELVDPVICFIRGQRIILDAELARIYGVTTKRLNEQVKRNRERFPIDFMFQLTAKESEPVAICDRFSEASRSALFALRLH